LDTRTFLTPFEYGYLATLLEIATTGYQNSDEQCHLPPVKGVLYMRVYGFDGAGWGKGVLPTASGK
jgi:hypothetical protein